MAPPYRTIRARRAHAEYVLLRAVSGAMFAVLGYIGCTTSAIGPGHGTPEPLVRVAAATIDRSGIDPMITGSVGSLFAISSFTGPNRAEKQDRARPIADVMEVTRGFEAIRKRLASLRMPQANPEVDGAVPDSGPQVAAVDPKMASPALDAIDAAAGGQDVSMPLMASQQLAYARADAPVTVFDGVLRDKYGKKVSDKELNCMATAIYFEARGESERGQIAVGQVVLNRVAHRLYPGTICSVVFQNQHRRNACQFSFACDGIPERVSDRKAWDRAERIAKGVISGTLYLTDVGHATHYHATYVYPHWAPRMSKVTKIGLHVFYQFKRGWKFG